MDKTVLAVVRLALEIITARILTIAGQLMTFGLACWAMYAPTQERLYLVAGFAILVFIPSVYKEARGFKERSNGQQAASEAE